MGKENLGSGLDYIIPGHSVEPSPLRQSNKVPSLVTSDASLDYLYRSKNGLKVKRIKRKSAASSLGGSLGY